MTMCCLPEALPYSTNQNLRIHKIPYVKSSHSTKQPQHSQHCSQVRAWHWTSPHYASVTAETHSSVCTQLTQTSKQREAESLTRVWVVPHLEIVTSNFLPIVQNKMYKKTPTTKANQSKNCICSVFFTFSKYSFNQYEISKAAHTKQFKEKGTDKIHLQQLAKSSETLFANNAGPYLAGLAEKKGHCAIAQECPNLVLNSG